MFHEMALGWKWAVSNQTWLHCKHDAYWLDAVRRKKFGENDWREFLKAYSLSRGHAARVMPHSFHTVWELFDSVYSSHIDEGDVVEIDRRWNTVIDELRCRTKTDDHVDGLELRSTAMKVFWLFQPAVVPMYDSYALRGIRAYAKTTPNTRTLPSATEFVRSFEAFFTAEEEQVRSAMLELKVQYPYRRRIAEKWLWLLGNKRRVDMLAKYKIGIESHENYLGA